MKKICVILSLLLLLSSLPACSSTESSHLQNIEPKVTQMKAICQLATLECYYHNVAKYYEEAVEGFGPWTKDRRFWVEYDGIVTLGVDTSDLKMEIDGTTVYITEPRAIIISVKVDADSLNKDGSFYVDVDSAKTTAEHEQKAYAEAQSKMRESAENDTALLESAKQRAMSLLEDYVQNIGNAIGKQYSVRWVDANGGSLLSPQPSDTASVS